MFVAQVAKERSKADELFQKVGFGYCPIDSQQMSSLLIVFGCSVEGWVWILHQLLANVVIADIYFVVVPKVGFGYCS